MAIEIPSVVNKVRLSLSGFNCKRILLICKKTVRCPQPYERVSMIKQNQFFEACEQGDLDSVQHYVYLQQCAPLGLDNLGMRLACKNGHDTVVRFLLRTPGIEKSTGLMKCMWAAIQMHHYHIVSLLVPHIDLDTNEGYLLKWAVVRGDNTLVAQLAPHLQIPHHVSDAFLDAVRNNDFDIVDILLLHVDPSLNESEAFHLACGRGHLDIVKRLLPLVDPRTKNSEGLLWACVGNHIHVIDAIWECCDVETVLNTQLLFSSDKGFNHLRMLWEPIAQKQVLLEALDGMGSEDQDRKI